MNKFTIPLFLVLLAQINASDDENTIYKFSAKDTDGNDVSLDKYR